MAKVHSLEEWLKLPTDEGCIWRQRARKIMRPVVEAWLAALAAGAKPDPRELLEEIDKAQDANRIGGDRWEQERTVLSGAIDGSLWPEPTQDDLAAVTVAADLVEEQRFSEAIALVAQQAPRALNRKCPACSEPRGIRCREIAAFTYTHSIPGGIPFSPEAKALKAAGEKWVGPRTRIVPHESRVAP